MSYLKSPMNYIGNKYRILKQIMPLFPKEIDTMVDLFCGGCDVILNTEASKKYANDINSYVIEIFEEMRKKGLDYVLRYIDADIDRWELSKTNEESYKAFRDFYNNSDPRYPLDLYVLMCYSFNYQFRFNSKHGFNNPFGRNRSSFNPSIRKNLSLMIPRLSNITFSTRQFQDFDFSVLKENDFLYADPPYLITTATYLSPPGSHDDGRQGIVKWDEKTEKTLYEILDSLSERNVKFALSNVSEHKGRKNDILLDWLSGRKYNLYYLDFNYNNASYHAKNTDKPTREILVTNYSEV